MSAHIPVHRYQLLPPLPNRTTFLPENKKDASFQNVFHETLEKNALKVSKHARKRLHERDVIVTASEWKDITKKVQEAKEKGVTDSVVLTKKAALVVSAKNNTVITAMKREEATSHIFTNINGTIVV